MSHIKNDYSKLSKAELMELLIQRDASDALNKLLETTEVSCVMEEKIKKTASLILNKDENTVMLHLHICDLFKLDSMMNNIYHSSLSGILDNHWRVHHLLGDEIQKNPSSVKDYLRLLEELNALMLIVAKNGDFCGDLHGIIKKVTDEL